MPTKALPPAIGREIRALASAGLKLERAAKQFAAAYRNYAAAINALREKQLAPVRVMPSSASTPASNNGHRSRCGPRG